MELLKALGLESPVFWYVPNKPGPGSIEVKQIDIEYAKLANFGVFFAVNQFGPSVNPSGNRRYEANAIRPTACFIDFDDGTKQEQAAKIASLKLPPSAVVETGRGYHVYWILSTGDFPLWRRVQSSLAVTYGGDKACKDPARLLRLPGSWHTKGEPFRVTLWELNSKRYSLSELEVFCPPEPEQVFAAPRFGSHVRTSKYLPVGSLFAGERHETLLVEAGKYLRGVAPVEVPDRILELKTWYATSCQPLKPNWEQEVDDVVSFVLAKELC